MLPFAIAVQCAEEAPFSENCAVNTSHHQNIKKLKTYTPPTLYPARTQDHQDQEQLSNRNAKNENTTIKHQDRRTKNN
jgi:hypothetical protein